MGADAALREQPATARSLGFAFRRQVDVNPAGEEVLRVPFAFAVPQQYQGSHASIFPSSVRRDDATPVSARFDDADPTLSSTTAALRSGRSFAARHVPAATPRPAQ